MRLTTLALCLTLLAALGAHAGQEKKDRERLQGTWKIVSANTGNADADRNLEGRTVKIVGDTIQTYNHAGESEGIFSFRLDPTKTPKQIDLSRTRDGREQTVYGIYALENGKLRLCWSARKDGGTRPADFNTVGTINEFRAYVLERQKDN